MASLLILPIVCPNFVGHETWSTHYYCDNVCYGLSSIFAQILVHLPIEKELGYISNSW